MRSGGQELVPPEYEPEMAEIQRCPVGSAIRGSASSNLDFRVAELVRVRNSLKSHDFSYTKFLAMTKQSCPDLAENDRLDQG